MAYVSRITRLTLLSPEIIHGVLTGQLDQIGVEKCKQPFPVLWNEQKKFFGIEERTQLLAVEIILPPFLFRGLYLTAKMVYYKCEVFYE